MKEQSCNDLDECVALRDAYVACAFNHRDYCLVSTPNACNSLCLTTDATAEFKAFLYCRLSCFAENVSSISAVIGMILVILTMF